MTMVGGESQKKLQTGARDRISELPKNLIEHILESMPIQDAVRTSALARNWRYKWTTISKLAFDENFYFYLEHKGLHKGESMRFIITHVLLHSNNPIISFDLYMPVANWEDTGSWMLFLARKGFKKLTLGCGHLPHIPLKLPSHIYSFVELTHINICGCRFNIPSKFRGFPNLIRLELFGVAVETESFSYFITNCPLLECMTLCLHHSTLGNLKIHSLSLKHLYMGDFVQSIYIDAKLLETLSVRPEFVIANPQAGVGNMCKTLGMLPRIEKLSLGNEALKFLPAVGATMTLPTPLTFLKKLRFHMLDFDNAAHIFSSLCLIRSPPSLRELKISGNYCIAGDVMEPVSCYLGDNIMLSCLKVVKFCDFMGSKAELGMIQYLLASSPSLEKMFIAVEPENGIKGTKITSELLRFVRLSPKAEIIYSECSA